MTAASIDFGYPWWLSYGHLLILGLALAGLAIAFQWKWPRWLMILFAAVALWSTSAFVVARTTLNVNARGTLPTENFLRSGQGKVLDIGAGTGRSSIMVLEARPQATLVALDLFGDSYNSHFGHGEDPQQRLLTNLKAAGVDARASIVKADMRKLPLETNSFDGIITAYTIDHLRRDGVTEALAEAKRVLKPGGDFMMMVVASDRWVKFAFGPLLMHTARSADWWAGRVREAGFDVVEQGTPPATVYVLAKKKLER